MSRHASGVQKNGTATLTYGNRRVDLPVYKATEGPDVVDIRKLYSDADLFTYDPGFTSTASCESDITFIDGDEGILLYRGYPIDQLAAQSSFLEVCHLLLYGELPNTAQMKEFARAITYHTMVHEQIASFFHGFRRDAHGLMPWHQPMWSLTASDILAERNTPFSSSKINALHRMPAATRGAFLPPRPRA